MNAVCFSVSNEKINFFIQLHLHVIGNYKLQNYSFVFVSCLQIVFNNIFNIQSDTCDCDSKLQDLFCI